MAIDAANSNRLYFGTTKVYQTVDGATSWQVLNGGASLNANATVVALAVGGGNNGNVVYAATGSEGNDGGVGVQGCTTIKRSEEHTSELQSHLNLVCRLLLEK